MQSNRSIPLTGNSTARGAFFPSDTALVKALYLATFEATKKWTMPMRSWGQVYGELGIMYEGRLPKSKAKSLFSSLSPIIIIEDPYFQPKSPAIQGKV